MEKIIYVGMYDMLHNGQKIRSYSLAEARKIDYIVSVLLKLKCDVDILSAAYINVNNIGYIRGSKTDICANKHLILPTSWSAKNKMSRILRIICSLWNVFVYLIRNTKRNSKVIVYHNYFYTIPVLAARLIKKFDLILEIEEQYAMVWKLSSWQKKKENMLLKAGRNKPLVVSEVLAKQLGIKYSIVSYGNYNGYKGKISRKGTGDTIKLIYTGSIDKTKESAYRAIDIMRYLPNNYELYISGYIENGEEDFFRKRIADANLDCGREACHYLGLLGDNKYQQLLLTADIALNLQQEGEFGSYLFPSKILTYLAYNLDVVTTRGDSIVHSAVSDILHIAKDYSCDSIVKTVLSVTFDREIDYRNKLKELSDTFEDKMKKRLGIENGVE